MKRYLIASLTGIALFCSVFSPMATAQTFDPEQRDPDGFTRKYKGVIVPKATPTVENPRVDPPNWWVGFQETQVELMIHDRDIHDHDVSIGTATALSNRYEGVKIVKIERPENRNYLFVTLDIAPETPEGTVVLTLTKDKDVRTHRLPLAKRRKDGIQGLTTADFVYLIMPDRFSDGDEKNNSFPTMTQTGIDRRKMYFRHGGDLLGVENHLDYLQELGVTAIWLNPVVENDQPAESYHGYAFSDHYNVDKRFGGNEAYAHLIQKSHEKGIKIVKDYVHNHFGDRHYTIKDLPEADWIHQFDTLTKSNYRDQTVFDPYGAKVDKEKMETGWFDVMMPDFNQKNAHVQRYLTQNTIWWVEQFGIDAYRLDTYLYNDQAFMSDWGRRMQLEFPKLTIFAETWVNFVANQAQATQNNYLRKPYNSHLEAVTDFQIYFSILEALTKPQGWDSGVMKLYQNLSNDFLYENPYKNVTFIDNHDLSRSFSILGENVDKMKAATACLLTMRGVPSWYYGAELLYKGYTNPDGKVRQDFEGGFNGDKINKFTAAGRNAAENDFFNFTKRIANWRKTKTCLHDGKLMQFVPIDGVYVYFRYDQSGAVMTVLNSNDKAVTLDTERFKERLVGFTTAQEMVNNAALSSLKKLNIRANASLILDLK